MAQDFIEKFHNLEGTLLKERKKSLFLLLDSHRSLQTEDKILQDINNQLIPKTYLEEIYKLEILLYFRRSSEILEFLKRGDHITADKILKQKWFIESLFDDLKSEEFVRKVFPQLSDIVRTKLLKQILKYIRDENYINALFDSLLQTYGLKHAMILLPGCSIEKIEEILLIRDFKISKAQLKLLHDKDPSLIEFYFEGFERKEGNVFQLDDFTKYISRKDPNLYLKLLLKYKFHIYQFGRQATKKFVTENKEAILKDVYYYLNLNVLNKDVLVKELGAQCPVYLRTRRRKLCTVPSLSLSEIKEKLLRCDDVEFRQELFVMFVNHCSLREDYDALLDILNLTCDRMSKTDDSVLYSLLNEIHRVIKLNKLTDEHWEYIHQIILMQNKRGVTISSSIAFDYSKYLYKNGKQFGKIIPICLKADDFSLRKLQFQNDEFVDGKCEKEFLQLTLKYFSNISEYWDKSSDIVLAIRDWNIRHPDDVIKVSEYRKIIHGIKTCLSNNRCSDTEDDTLSSMKYLVCRENLSEEFTDIYFSEIIWLKNVAMSKWYLKYKPNVFQEKIHEIAEYFYMGKEFCLVKYFKKYEHTVLVQEIKNYYLEKLKDPKEESKDKFVQLLASIMPKNEYLKLLEKYVPTIDKLDLIKSTKEERNLHLIQIELAKSVRFTTCQVQAFPILLKYCRGDYFQPSLFSLYSCFIRIPEKSLEMLLDFLLQKPVSVRKHTIFLAALVFPIETNEKMGRKIFNTEKNDSIKKHLFTSTYKYFLKNPQDSFWHILHSYMGYLTLYEEESLMLLTDIHNVPDSYKCVFIKRVYQVFNDLEVKEERPLNVYYDALMKNISDDKMKLLPKDLCVHIINNKLFNEEYGKNHACVDFIIKFMFICNIKEKIEIFSNILDLYKQKHQNGPYENVARSVIQSISKKIFEKIMIETEIPKEFPLILSEEFKKMFLTDEFLEEYLMLYFMILKHENKKSSSFYAREIWKLFKVLRESYGDSIIELFKDFLSLSLKPLLGYDPNSLKLLELLVIMIETDPSPPNCLLVIQVLPKCSPDDIKAIRKYKYVLKKLQTSENIVQIYLNNYLRHPEYYT